MSETRAPYYDADGNPRESTLRVKPMMFDRSAHAGDGTYEVWHFPVRLAGEQDHAFILHEPRNGCICRGNDPKCPLVKP